MFPLDMPDRGYLLEEYCRFCHRKGGVWFVIDNSPFGINTSQVLACDLCKSSWTVDSGMVPSNR